MKSLNPPIEDWKDKRVWIIGASSGIGESLAKSLSGQGAHLALSARRSEPLLALATRTDLVIPMDVTDQDSIKLAMSKLSLQWDAIDLVIYCAGIYQPMRAWNIDLATVEQTLSVNLKGIYLLLDQIMPRFLQQNNGGICLVGSVAGYTGLPKALIYGPTKAALINLAQILYCDLSEKGIGVYLVNPGFVDTRLTRQNDFSMPALISPDKAARHIITGLRKGLFEIHFPKRFTWWLKLLSSLPYRLRFSLLKRAVSG